MSERAALEARALGALLHLLELRAQVIPERDEAAPSAKRILYTSPVVFEDVAISVTNCRAVAAP